MKQDRPRIATVAIATLVFLVPALVGAQITYTRALGNGRYEIRQMNGNGRNDSRITFPFNRIGFPTWSKDGTRLSVSAFRPNRVTNRTWNIYERRPRVNGVNQLTRYRDILDPTTNSASYTFPWYKAYAPNNRFLAVNSLVRTGGPNSTGTGGGVVEFAVLEVHSLTRNANPVLVHVDKTKNGRHHGGEGVDWSPARNLLAAPCQSGAPFLSGGGQGETTAIFLMPPSRNAFQRGLARQVTFPRADANIVTGVMWTEHDHMPKFSPNGAGLAYVRSFQSHSLLTSLTPDPCVPSLRIRNMNTGADREIRRFPRGTYITTISWSPNGNRLVFDLARQANSVVGPLLQGREETNQIYRINVNGTGLTQLRGNRNGNPSWR